MLGILCGRLASRPRWWWGGFLRSPSPTEAWALGSEGVSCPVGGCESLCPRCYLISLCSFSPAFAFSPGTSHRPPWLTLSFWAWPPPRSPGEALQPPSQQSGLRSLLVPPGPSWSPLIPPGPSWSLLIPPGPSWSLLIPPGPSWHLLTPPGPS